VETESKQYVKDLKDKETVLSIFLAADKAVLTDRNGKPYLTVNLTDATGSINARIWDKVDDWAKLFDSGDFVRVKGHVQTYQNRRQIIVHDIQKTNVDQVKLKDFVGGRVEDPHLLLSQLEGFVGMVEDSHIRRLLELTLGDETIRLRLLKAPAAKSIHHAYMGGLLEHVVSICGIMKSLAGHYPIAMASLI
jgi:3'-5' exoribonuclease